MSLLTLSAPAKVNLTLEVLGKRADGYHEIRSVLQTVRLCDRLSFSPAPELSFACDLPGWQAEKSLVARAAKLLIEKAGPPGGAMVEIAKRIPLSSGLGGDASDGAATLRGLNDLWQLKIPPGRLVEMAAELGSDVPFFLTGGTCLAEGRGELISPLPVPARLWLVILMPDIPVPEHKTATLYARLGPADYTAGESTDALVQGLTRGEAVAGRHFYNAFESAADDTFPGLARYRASLLTAGAASVHLAGAGPALFSAHASREEALRLQAGLKGCPSFLAETLNSGEAC